MATVLRKFSVWFVSFIVIVSIYILYSLFNQTPVIKIDRPAEQLDEITDFNSTGGMIGDVGVKAANVARFIDLNEDTNEVEREWGFAKLLHKDGDEWELEKPFMKVFRPNLTCDITAKNGMVQIEKSAGDQPTPKDAKLSGNVVIHILPQNNSSASESWVYLDDITYISERSLFTTPGPVKFVSENVQLQGKGLEIIYNEGIGQLEFLKIISLKKLIIKRSADTAVVPSQREKNTQTAVKKTDSQEPVNQKLKNKEIENNVEKTAQIAPNVPEPSGGKKYKCLFNENVVIDTPKEIICAEQLFINNILFSQKSSQETTVETSAQEKPQKDSGSQIAVGEKSQSPVIQVEEDIVVTCDGGIFVVPMDSLRDLGKLKKVAVKKSVEEFEGKTVFVAERIEHNLLQRDTLATGSSTLKFYAKGMSGEPNDETVVPVKVTADKKVEFVSSRNQVIFEGNCNCEMTQTNPEFSQHYTLKGDTLTVDIASDKSAKEHSQSSEIERITVTGKVVRLATFKKAGEKLLGGTQLKCRKFEFDTSEQVAIATGPGTIAVDNSMISDPNEKAGKLSFKKRCYAQVKDFDLLKYFFERKKIIAEAASHQIHIGYIPVTPDGYGQAVNVYAGHIEADLIETPDHKTEIAQLVATDGINYQDGDNQFLGSRLAYDAEKGLIFVTGDGIDPPLLNGARVDRIEYDVINERIIHAEILSPGTLQMK